MDILTFSYGSFYDESDVGLGYGYSCIKINTKTGEISINDFYLGDKPATPAEARRFVYDFWDEFLDDPQIILDIIDELHPDTTVAA